MLSPGIHLALSRPAEISNGRRSALTIRVAGRKVGFPAVSPSVKRALRRLERGGQEGELASFASGDDVARLAEWYYCLGALERSGGITYTVRSGSRPIARAVVLSPYFTPSVGAFDGKAQWQLSRFAYVRRDGARLVLESPLSCARVELLDREAAAVVNALSTSVTASDVEAQVPGLSAPTIASMLSLLKYVGVLTRVREDGRTEEDFDPQLRTWHFADLLFHGRSREGRHADKFETFRHLGQLPPLPVTKAPMSAKTIALHAPDVKKLEREDTPFTRVVERRRSIRSYGRNPITVAQVGEFLYRVARIKDVIKADGDSLLYDATRRPYPGGGAAYEHEFYVVAGRCTGLKRGIYHYDAMHHRLEVLPAAAGDVTALIRDAKPPIAPGPCQVLIIVAARFQRITWKYNSSSYAPMLKNIGVLLQTMYLVATAMRLAPCALGSGNSERFARIVGTEWHVETSIGEFMLGSLPASELPAAR